jgi:hypothetical protein
MQCRRALSEKRATGGVSGNPSEMKGSLSKWEKYYFSDTP